MAAARPAFVLAIDQGTTSTRAVLFDADGQPRAQAQQELEQHYPQPGWVEHDPEAIWQATLDTARAVLAERRLAARDIAAIGITNQRETTVLWERSTGRPIARAIVWQDRRTAARCAELVAAGHGELVRERTGLVIDPYFSATKLAWILDNVSGARTRAERGELAFGTVDAFLLWRLTNGAVHATDATNASRTMLYDIRAGAWDEGMLRLFRVPRAILPEVRDTAGEFGTSAPEHLSASVPIRAMIGDQQSALIGQACVEPGMVKATYGTGAFLLINIGEAPARSRHRLLTTVAYQWRGKRTYALEGSIFSAGATVQWLRDGLQIIAAAPEAGERAAKVASTEGVYCVPAFAGLGAPYWSSDARALLCGLTRGTSRDVIARAALESVGYQTRDLIEAMAADAGQAIGVIRVDGGMAASDWTMQFVADMGAVPVDRPANLESTALGAAFAAGWQAGLSPGPESFAERRRADRVFTPAMDEATREALYRGWREAVQRAL
ncbi:MAG TPA: glycerol kinase GlpK [Stellaceae bacterium]|nr:glycerol kinase GlpK [Stellaceae bacterium]